MANTKRRSEYTDRNGAMFIPMNVEGGVWNEHFITTPKLICIVMIAISLFLLFTYLQSIKATILGYIIFIGGWFFVSSLILRFIVFEEKFYYRMYKELEKHEISSPALFWDIASMKDTDDGAILTYSDARIGIMVKVDRDTITGKSNEFKETHYDAISDFYREIAISKYNFVQMNIMEQAGKDPRLNELSKVVYKSDNPNICKLMELEVGYIKNITRSSLYESDYFLFYTRDLSKIDSIVQDITEALFKLLDGAYMGYSIMTSKDIVDFVKDTYGVNYFNSTEASLLMVNRGDTASMSPFSISGILWDDDEIQELDNREKNKLRGLTSAIINGTRSQNDISLKKAVYRKDVNKNIGVDFGKLSGDTSKINSNTVNNNQMQYQNNLNQMNSQMIASDVQNIMGEMQRANDIQQIQQEQVKQAQPRQTKSNERIITNINKKPNTVQLSKKPVDIKQDDMIIDDMDNIEIQDLDLDDDYIDF